MPKASSTAVQSSAAKSVPYSAAHPNVLKRNQACHQCRRRKLKWSLSTIFTEFVSHLSYSDAKRPCSTCLRSHAHAVSHAPPGAQLPSVPACTFDDVPEASTSISDGPKNRYEKLESRITELEALLRQRDSTLAEVATILPHSTNHAPHESNGDTDTTNSPTLTSSSGHLGHPLSLLSRDNSHSPTGYTHPYPNGNSQILSKPAESSPRQDNYMISPVNTVPATSPLGLEVTWPSWPPNLPGPDLLRHLVEVFFLFHPHATRLFHSTSFMASLALSPSHPKFPASPVLHAICAVGSLYTAAVTSPPFPDFSKVDPDEIFTLKHRLKEDRPDSFAEEQAKLSKDGAEHLTLTGQDLFQVLQANVIISWYYYSHAKWVELFMSTAHSLRLAVPLGLNICPPFHSISKSVKPVSILAPARTVVEDETRRNTFWLAYACDRQHGSSNGWAFSLDDQDISQLLPVRGDQFEHGTLVTPHDRQWAHTTNLILTQPEDQIDSFILYIKAHILLSQVKTFNLRFRARHFSGDQAVTAVAPYPTSPNPSDPVDPRGSPAFVELDHLVSSFLPSFPSHLRNPINNNVVDNHLYATCLMTHVSNIVLHDPHADVRKSGCISALKILTSARAILDLIYTVWSTSYDISLLDPCCSFCWFLGGRVLVRFLQAAIESNSQDQISTLRGELDFVQSAISKCGKRVPLAFRLNKMLSDLVVSSTGEVPSELSTNHSVFQSMYEENP